MGLCPSPYFKKKRKKRKSTLKTSIAEASAEKRKQEQTLGKMEVGRQLGQDGAHHHQSSSSATFPWLDKNVSLWTNKDLIHCPGEGAKKARTPPSLQRGARRQQTASAAEWLGADDDQAGHGKSRPLPTRSRRGDEGASQPGHCWTQALKRGGAALQQEAPRDQRHPLPSAIRSEKGREGGREGP